MQLGTGARARGGMALAFTPSNAAYLVGGGSSEFMHMRIVHRMPSGNHAPPAVRAWTARVRTCWGAHTVCIVHGLDQHLQRPERSGQLGL